MVSKEDIKEYIDDLVRIIDDPIENGWTHIIEKRGVKVFSKQFDDSDLTSIRGEGIIQSNSSAILKLLMDAEKRKEWDLFYEAGHIIQQIDPKTALCYMKTKSGYGVWPRDFVFVCAGEEKQGPGGPEGEKEVILVSASVDADEMPAVSGVVRGQIVVAGYRLRPVQSPDGKHNWTHVHYGMEIDLAGWIPPNVADLVNQYSPLSLIGIRKSLVGTSEAPSPIS